jgi:7,8-dihydropterin-6-yl-methyl-4-(beta-D-ribofuranosyl)aminobenzene 5'-phosphate synthase
VNEEHLLRSFAVVAAAFAVSATTAPAVGEDVKITVVYDNNEYDRRLETGWGFACTVEGFEKTVLFDTGGDGDVLLANMAILGLTPEEVDVVVLSHIHGDHVGGLGRILEENAAVTVYVPASFPTRFKEEVKKYCAAVVEVKDGCDICPGVRSTGEMGTSIVEQALVAETPRGFVVITGCAHPGIVNVVGRARELYGDGVQLLMGGFHLRGARDAELENIAAVLREMGVRYVGPCHCSGERARELFAEEFGELCVEVGVGKIVEPSRLE